MNDKYVITISHQLGCGGSYIGEKLAEKLGIPFINSQILQEVADRLGVSREDVAAREEKKLSFWAHFLQGEALAIPMPGETLAAVLPTDEAIHDIETRYIKQIANHRSCIILGRGGNHILHKHPHHLRVFTTADPAARVKRIAALYKITKEEAERMMNRNDKEREAYIRHFTGDDMTDMKLYDICIDTTSLGMDNAVTVIECALHAKLGKL